jgi:hypothetical protein
MRRRAPALLVACALGAAAPAVAQTTKQTPGAAQPPERPAAERPALNLKLDNPSSWATAGPDAGKESANGLPKLGADARPINPPDESRSGPRTSPYPSEPSPGR